MIEHFYNYFFIIYMLFVFNLVCSPSPCASIDTVTDDDDTKCENKTINDNDSVCTISTAINESREKLFPIAQNPSSGNVTPTPTQMFNEKLDKFDELESNADNFRERSLRNYLHTFDRRNSDTSYLVNRRASGERINLADEIRKLSDHLLMLAEINSKLGNETKNELSMQKTSKTTIHKTACTTKANSQKSKSSTIKSKTSATTSTSTSNPCNGENLIKNSLSLSKRLQQSIEETPILGQAMPKCKSTVHTKIISNVKSHIDKDKSMETAKTRRSKFRVNQMSRDVPIGVPNTHQPVNLEDAAKDAKDCLLHLLEKYNDSKARNPLGRHQSISVDWNFSDNLEHRSMSSINAFFQRHTNSGENVRQLQAQLENKSLEKKN